MAVCINKNSLMYQTLKLRSGISEFILESVCRDFLEKHGRLPYLDEIPGSNSESYLKDRLKVTEHGGAKITNILEVAGKGTVEEAIVSINNQFRDLETTIVPINKEALVDIVHRPTDDNFNNWSEEDEILARAPRDDSGNLLAPNGKISNLTEKLYVLVRTKAFKRWFGDWENDPTNASKVVDENGEPLVVYHGNRTDNKITTFDSSKKGTEHKERAISGFWFTTDKDIAKEEYALKPESKGRGIEYLQYGEVIPVFLNIKNPIETEQQGITVLDTLYGILTTAKEKLDDFINRSKALAKENTDGYILTFVDSDNRADDFVSKQTQLVVNNPNQIKSAISNSGSFNRLSGNIYDTEPNDYLVLNNTLQKLAKLYGINFNTVTDAELNSERWADLMPESRLVNAFIYDGQIYINVDRANLDAPLHEMLHIFVGSMRFTNPKLYQELIQLSERFPNYDKLASLFSGKTRNDINEEVFITEVSKHLTGQKSSLTGIDEKLLYEISYNVHRVLDSVLMGTDSSKTITDDRLYTLSLKDLAFELNSAIMTNNMPPLRDPELHRTLNNMKSDLMKEGKLEEICD